MRSISLNLIVLAMVVPAVYSLECVQHEQSSLLEFKQSVVFKSAPSYKLVSWNASTDCCIWAGVTCSSTGHVIVLDLTGEQISGGMDTSSIPLSHLHHLRRLDLSENYFTGPLHISLVKLQQLSEFDLSFNNLSTVLPDFLHKFSNLTALKLRDCELFGSIPEKIFSVATLQTLDLSQNELLSGTLPDTIGNLKMLKNLVLWGCNFSGPITNIYWENFDDLVFLSLSNNMFTGNIPLSLFSLPSLKYLYFSNNQFSGQIADQFTIASSSSVLEIIFIGNNRLDGPIPMSILKFESLKSLDVSYNNFSGVIDLHNIFHNRDNLTYIDLSFNSLSIIQTGGSTTTVYPSFPLEIYLGSCNLKAFPDFLRNLSLLDSLDLSQNQIHGPIPDWVWKLSLSFLNLSHNSLTGFQGSFPNRSSLNSIKFLDLNSNLLQDQIPLPPSAVYLDYSRNNFSSILIPNKMESYGPQFGFFSLASNNFQGSIPPSMCNVIRGMGDVIDLSNNSFTGGIPPCLIKMTGFNFGVLNLRRNKLSGDIPNLFKGNCSLQTLDLSENQLSGKVPSSIVHCKRLKVLNLGNNEINGAFPCWLKEISSLRVLVLKSNRFHGSIRCELTLRNVTSGTWPKLQIFDIAANNFSGELPYESFNNWEAMMVDKDSAPSVSSDLRYEYVTMRGYYQDTVTITSKGLDIQLVKILTILTSIDLSCNNFRGPIPPSIGDLKALFSLNLSYNHFAGEMPSSLGNLRELESLDLANNSLSGDIPVQLASLNFLSVLNLSFNQLVGRIPTSTQLQSFSEMSYTGNKGLCGPPLEINCTSSIDDAPIDPASANTVDMEIDWQVVCAEIGYAAGLGSVIGSLVFWKRWRLWYFSWIDQLIFRIFPQLDPRIRRVHKRVQLKRQ